MTEPSPTSDDARLAESGRLALIGLLVIQIFVGYEWLMSGLTKLWRGGFPSGLADELREKSEGTVGWYASFLDGTVIPNGNVFGVVIELGELIVGAALMAAAVIWLWRGSRLSGRAYTVVLMTTLVASVAAIVMNVNFHLANGSGHPWLIPKDGFDEGVDLDSLMPLIQLVFAAVAGKLLLARRHSGSAVPTPDASHTHARVAG